MKKKGKRYGFYKSFGDVINPTGLKRHKENVYQSVI